MPPPRKQLDNYHAAVRIIKTLKQHGHDAYLVGGCVRDMLLDRVCTEHDVATNATPEHICRIFSNTRQVGAKFGVVLVSVSRQWIEVATFRTEGAYLDGRHPQQVTFSNIRQDALRRDFTINGMYLDPQTGQITDDLDGQQDIKARTIRAIGDPQRRFAEDHLRMLRAVRFATLLDFQIHPNTTEAIKSQAARIKTISAERIGEELAKILASPARGRGITLIQQLGLLEHIIPELAALNQQAPSPWAQSSAGQTDRLVENAFCETLAVLDHLPPQPTLPLSTAALLHLVGLTVGSEVESDRPVRSRPPTLNSSAELAQQICRNLTYSNNDRRKSVWLIQYLPFIRQVARLQIADIKRMMIYKQFAALDALYHARVQAGLEDQNLYDQLLQRVSTIDQGQLPPAPLMDGNDLQKLTIKIPPKPVYQQLLDAVYDMQLNGQVQTHQQALAAADKIAQQMGLSGPQGQDRIGDRTDPGNP